MPRATRQAAKISFDDFTVAVSSALLRAVDARKLPRMPILIGIVFWPGEFGQPGGGTRPGAGGPAGPRRG